MILDRLEGKLRGKDIIRANGAGDHQVAIDVQIAVDVDGVSAHHADPEEILLRLAVEFKGGRGGAAAGGEEGEAPGVFIVLDLPSVAVGDEVQLGIVRGVGLFDAQIAVEHVELILRTLRPQADVAA